MNNSTSTTPLRRLDDSASGRIVDAVDTIQVVTSVVCLGCLVIGALGLKLGYPEPMPPAREPEPMVAERVEVELTREPVPLVSVVPVTPATPPPLMASIAPPAAPSLAAVAEPSPAITFPLPVVGPVRVVEVADTQPTAAPSGPSTNSVPASTQASVGTPSEGTPAIQPLVFGQGDGRQPAPRYPSRARTAGQEGTVVVRLQVLENGRVSSAVPAQPCPWPLLNDEAVRTVRELWRFRPGPVRLYEVPIRFELGK